LGGNRGPGSCPDEGTDRSSSATADRATDDGTGCSAHDRAAKWVLRCGMFKGGADCERKQASEREFRHHVGSPKSQIILARDTGAGRHRGQVAARRGSCQLAKGKISHWIRLFCAALDLP
jgi:hypothetical protein